MCSGVGTGSVLELQQSCEEFCENHVGYGPGLLLCRVNNRITGFHKPQHTLTHSLDFSYKTYSS